MKCGEKEEDKEEDKAEAEAGSLPLNNLTTTKEFHIQVEEALETLEKVSTVTTVATILIMSSQMKRDVLIKGIMTTMKGLQWVTPWEEAEGPLTVVAMTMTRHLATKAEVATNSRREDAIMMITIFHQNSKHKRSGTSKITAQHKIVAMGSTETVMKEASVVEEAVEAHLVARAPIGVRTLEETLKCLEEEEEAEETPTTNLPITITTLVVETTEEEALVISKEDKEEAQILVVCKDQKAEDFIIQLMMRTNGMVKVTVTART
jgi:hypothetical protein